MPRIFLMEDEEKVAAFIKKGLAEKGYSVITASNGLDARALTAENKFDLLIFDVMVPGIGGIDMVRLTRQTDQVTPILMLTALGSTADKVLGLKSGADDYLVKPFHFDELLARVEALLRRHHAIAASTQFLRFSGLTLDTFTKTAERDGKHISLTAKEYALLEMFMNNPNKMLSRQHIAETVWGIDFETGTNVIDVYVNYLRNKVDKGFDVKLIQTVVGMGYILKD
jgi:two-component system copper resistance phosphate regulon response regulator CusR